jgi:hypothetical protein
MVPFGFVKVHRRSRPQVGADTRFCGDLRGRPQRASSLNIC